MVGTAKLINSRCTRRDVEAREYTSLYQVDSVETTLGQGPVSIILFATNLPQLGDYYGLDADMSDGDTFAVCVGYGEIAPLDWSRDRKTWTVTVNYSTDPNKQRRAAQNYDNPLNKPPIISGNGFKNRAAAHDVNLQGQGDGLQVRNKAGGMFPDREVLVDRSSNVLRITKNYPSIDLGVLDDFTDSVNSVAWMDGAPRTWKMEPAAWRKVYFANTAYYEITYEFHSNPETWDLKPRNMGKHDKNGDPVEVGNVVVNDFVDLDLLGLVALPAFGVAVDPVKFDGQGPNPDPFRWYKERDFTQLGLPSTP